MASGSAAASAAGSAGFESNSPVSISTFLWNILSITKSCTNVLSVVRAGLVESLLEVHSALMISETNGIEALLYLAISKVLAEEAPGTVASRVLLLHITHSVHTNKNGHRIDDVVQNQLQGLLLTHDDSLRLLRLVLQNANFSSASLLPNVLTHLITVFVFLEEKEQSGTPRNGLPNEHHNILVEHDFLVLLASLRLYSGNRLLRELQLGILNVFAIGSVFNILGHIR